jgi:hypothetical protein
VKRAGAAAGVALLLALVPARSAAPADGQCTDNVGVTIVVDFQDLGGGVNLACAPGQVRDGLDALTRAGVSWEGTKRFPGVVCRIAGKPGSDTEQCVNTPPANAYWGYWIASRGGQWCYATVGAANRTPPPGTVEGWSFVKDKPDAPPPRYAPPPASPGDPPPHPIDASDCGAPAPPPPPPPPQPPPQPQPQPEPAITVTQAPSRPGEPPLSTTTTAAPAATTSTTSTTAGATETTGVGVTSTSGAVAINQVDLGDDGRGGAGSAVPLVATAGVIAGLGGAGIATRRRRRNA